MVPYWKTDQLESFCKTPCEMLMLLGLWADGDKWLGQQESFMLRGEEMTT